jgi:hypothetical protein
VDQQAPCSRIDIAYEYCKCDGLTGTACGRNTTGSVACVPQTLDTLPFGTQRDCNRDDYRAGAVCVSAPCDRNRTGALAERRGTSGGGHPLEPVPCGLPEIRVLRRLPAGPAAHLIGRAWRGAAPGVQRKFDLPCDGVRCAGSRDPALEYGQAGTHLRQAGEDGFHKRGEHARAPLGTAGSHAFRPPRQPGDVAQGQQRRPPSICSSTIWVHPASRLSARPSQTARAGVSIGCM